MNMAFPGEDFYYDKQPPDQTDRERLLATDRCNNCKVHNIGSFRSIVLRILLLSRSEQSGYRHVYAVKYYLNQPSFTLLDRIFQKAGSSDGKTAKLRYYDLIAF